MTKDFNELKEEMVQAYVDNFDAADTNEQVVDWIKDTYPEFDVTVNNAAMNNDFSSDDVMNNDNIIKVNNEGELQNKEFVFDEQWVVA